MKTPKIIMSVITAALSISLAQVSAQDGKSSGFSVGADLYSNYIWRGHKLGTGPAIQPTVKFATGGLTVGVWGSFDAGGYTEVDPYISYSLPFGLSVGLTDYYSPSLALFETIDSLESHALEFNAGFTVGGFSLSANYIFNEAKGIESKGNDMYFQAGYSFKHFSILIGAGDGWHTTDGKFNFCNITLGTSKEIKITETFSIPVTGQVVVNTDLEALYVVVGFSL